MSHPVSWRKLRWWIHFGLELNAPFVAPQLSACIRPSVVMWKFVASIPRRRRRRIDGTGSAPTAAVLASLRELADMSGKFLAFLTPSHPCPHLDVIYSMKFTRTPLLRPLFHDPLWCGRHISKLLYSAVASAPRAGDVRACLFVLTKQLYLPLHALVLIKNKINFLNFLTVLIFFFNCSL